MHIHQQNHWNDIIFYWYQSYHWYQWTIGLQLLALQADVLGASARVSSPLELGREIT